MFKIFIPADALAETYLREFRRNGSNQSKWYKILLKQSNICTIGYDESDVDPMSDSNIINILAKSYSTINIEPKDKYISLINDNPEIVMENPNSLFYLDIPSKLAKSIQNHYGVMCQSAKKKIDTKPLTTIPGLIDFNKFREVQITDCWKEVFKVPSLTPSNGLCIIDRNLFSNDWYWKNLSDKKYMDGVRNVFCILENALPNNFDKDYHVTIICEQPSGSNSDISQNNQIENLNPLDTLSELLFSAIELLKRNYNIVMEIIAFKKGSRYYNELTHNRQIISNYYRIDAPNGLGLSTIRYKEGQETAQYGQNVMSFLLYSTGLNSCGSDCPIRSNERVVNDYNKFINYWRKNCETDEYWYACNTNKTFLDHKNRLFY